MAGRCDCAQPCSCALASTESIAVGGAGTSSSPFIMAVRYSTDECNQAQPGSDGGVHVPPPCILGPDGLPLGTAYDDPCCLVIPAPCILDYGGEPIEPDEDGCIQLPPTPPVGELGCGLTTGEGGETIVEVTDEYATMVDLQGQSFGGSEAAAGATVCATDGLRGLPDHTTAIAQMPDETVHSGLKIVPDTFSTSASSVATLTNPSPARRMYVECHLACMVDLVTSPLGGAEVRLQQNLNGGGWTTIEGARWPEPTVEPGEPIRYRGQVTATRLHQVAAAGSLQLQLRVQIHEDGTGTDYPVLVEAKVSARMIGHTI